MAQPIVKYAGGDVTCYPGSNQTDDGKINLEYNMARIVTRVTSKNFCIVKPSFEIEVITNIETGLPQLRILKGQACINGMDLIMINSIVIDPPEGTGKYHLAFKLARDSSNNVLGDLVYGSSSTFEGVYLSYYDNKPDPLDDPDMLYLGELEWDGNEFSNIKEDEDKYGRLWAEDIFCKINDIKHGDITRLNLQEWINKVPDWYFSKEGDTIYGPITIVDNRENNNPGIIINVDETGSHLTIKDPSTDNNKLQFYGDLNRDGLIDQTDADLVKQYIDGTITLTDLQLKLADVNHDGVVDEKDLQLILNYIHKEKNPGDTGNIYYIDASDKGTTIDSTANGTTIRIEKGKIYEDVNDGVLHIHNEGNICLDAEGSLKVEADKDILISTEDADSPYLKLDDDNVIIGNPNNDLKFNISFPTENNIYQTLGKAIWEYDSNSNNVILHNDNVNLLISQPNANFNNSIRVQDTIYLGRATTWGTEKTYLKNNEWQLSNRSQTINFTPSLIDMYSVNTSLSSQIKLRDTNDNMHTIVNANGTIELKHISSPVSIAFKDNDNLYDISLSKVMGAKRLNLSGDLGIENLIASETLSGKELITTNGILTFKKGTNDATITKDNNTSNLRTSSNLYIGSAGNSNLYAGNVTFTGSSTLGSAGQCKIGTNGSIETSGTIRGSKVYNAVYNDIVEFMEKEDYNEVIEPGDVVYFNNEGKVCKWHKGINSTAIAGIVSSEETYGYALGGDGLEDNQKVPVALKGRVWVKTDNIMLKAGDILAVNACGCVYKQDEQIFNIYTLGIATKPEENGKVWLMIK